MNEETSDQKYPNVPYRGVPFPNKAIAVATFFLYGFSGLTGKSFSQSIDNIQVLLITKSIWGLFYSIIGLVVVWIWAYLREERVTDRQMIERDYSSSRRAIIVFLSGFFGLQVVRLYLTGGQSWGLVVDLMVLAALVLSFAKRIKYSAHCVSVYSALIVLISGVAGRDGLVLLMLLSFALATYCVVIERRFSWVVPTGSPSHSRNTQ